MDAGRKLDLRIAELLGWTDIIDEGYGASRGVPPQYTGNKRRRRALTRWSTSWAAMEQVVEAMQARGWWLYLRIGPAGCDASFDTVPPPHNDFPCQSWRYHEWTRGEDPPHAVCEAAIAAMAHLHLNDSPS